MTVHSGVTASPGRPLKRPDCHVGGRSGRQQRGRDQRIEGERVERDTTRVRESVEERHSQSTQQKFQERDRQTDRRRETGRQREATGPVHKLRWHYYLHTVARVFVGSAGSASQAIGPIDTGLTNYIYRGQCSGWEGARKERREEERGSKGERDG